jgi:hypothetical protein
MVMDDCLVGAQGSLEKLRVCRNGKKMVGFQECISSAQTAVKTNF